MYIFPEGPQPVPVKAPSGLCRGKRYHEKTTVTRGLFHGPAGFLRKSHGMIRENGRTARSASVADGAPEAGVRGKRTARELCFLSFSPRGSLRPGSAGAPLSQL